MSLRQSLWKQEADAEKKRDRERDLMAKEELDETLDDEEAKVKEERKIERERKLKISPLFTPSAVLLSLSSRL